MEENTPSTDFKNSHRFRLMFKVKKIRTQNSVLRKKITENVSTDKQTRNAVAYVIYDAERKKFLSVQRPESCPDLPNVWGLPAGNVDSTETFEEAVKRSGQQKLGVNLEIIKELNSGNQERKDYNLYMKLFEAKIINGEPIVPQPITGVTQYQKWKWAEPETIVHASQKGSLCSTLFLTLRKTSQEKPRKIIVLEFDGNILPKSSASPDISTFTLIACSVSKLVTGGYNVVVVVGGGKTADHYIHVATQLSAPPVVADLWSALVSDLNARLLIEALGDDLVYSEPATSLHTLQSILQNHMVVVVGGLQPGLSTSEVAALCAEHCQAERVYCTNKMDGPTLSILEKCGIPSSIVSTENLESEIMSFLKNNLNTRK